MRPIPQLLRSNRRDSRPSLGRVLMRLIQGLSEARQNGRLVLTWVEIEGVY